MATLYYVHFLPNPEFGSTTDISTILRNVMCSGNEFKNYIDNLINNSINGNVKYFTAAGRFLVYLEVQGNWESGLMEFNDMLKSIEGENLSEFSKISFKYCSKDKTLDHLQLWSKFFEMKESILFNKDAIELKLIS